LCTDSGVYLQNFLGCSQCNIQNRAPDSLISKGKNTIEEIDEDEDITKEITTFERKLFEIFGQWQHLFVLIKKTFFSVEILDTCTKCFHVIAKHTHEFWIEDGYQEYRMDCLICGIGEDSISILPRDPRKVSQILF